MIGHPRYVLLEAICRYLDCDAKNALLKTLAKEQPKQDRKFLSILQEHFDINKFKDDAVYPEDIWLYNYLQYEVKNKLLRKGLIIKYSNKFKFIEDKAIFAASVAGL